MNQFTSSQLLNQKHIRQWLKLSTFCNKMIAVVDNKIKGFLMLTLTRYHRRQVSMRSLTLQMSS